MRTCDARNDSESNGIDPIRGMGEVFMSYAIIGFGKIGRHLLRRLPAAASLLHCMILASVNASSGTAKLAPYRESHRTTIRLKV